MHVLHVCVVVLFLLYMSSGCLYLCVYGFWCVCMCVLIEKNVKKFSNLSLLLIPAKVD